jgi:hypothetical protein
MHVEHSKAENAGHMIFSCQLSVVCESSKSLSLFIDKYLKHQNTYRRIFSDYLYCINKQYAVSLIVFVRQKMPANRGREGIVERLMYLV